MHLGGNLDYFHVSSLEQAKLGILLDADDESELDYLPAPGNAGCAFSFVHAQSANKHICPTPAVAPLLQKSSGPGTAQSPP